MKPEVGRLDKLIEMVRARPCLWDFRRSDYKDIEKTKQTWDEIASYFNITREYLKQQWKKLRDSYFRAKKVSLEKQASEGFLCKPKWRYFDAMSFLTLPDCPGNTVTNGNNQVFPSQVHGASSSSNFGEFKTELVEADEPSLEQLMGVQPSIVTPASSIDQPIQSGVILDSQTVFQSSTAAKRRKLSCDPISTVTGSVWRNSTSRLENLDTLNDEEEAAFGRMVAATLRRLNRRNRSLAKLKISQVLYEQEQHDIADSEASWWAPSNDFSDNTTEPEGSTVFPSNN